MDDFDVLARDFGFRPQGKSSPIKSATVTEENRNNNSKSTSAMSDFDYDAIFKNSASTNNEEAKSKATSVNSPVYDDDIFDGMPGLKSKSVSSSASTRYEENIFASMTISPPRRNQQRDHFDDILGNPSRAQKVEPTKQNRSKSSSGFEDLIPGFGSGRPMTSNRSSSEPNPKSTANTKETSNTMHNPFVVLESSSTTANARQSFSIDQQEEIGNVSKFDSPKSRGSSASEVLFADMDPHNGFDKSAPAFKSKDSTQKASFRYSESRSQEMPVNHFQESHRDIPAVPKNHHRSFDQSASAPSYMESNFQMGTSPTSENVQVADDIWLTVSEIPLFTQPTRARPPSRPPPPIPRHILKPERGSLRSNSRKAGNGLSSPNSAKYPQSPRPFQPAATSPLSDAHSAEEMDSNLATAAMKEAMDRAEAKFRHAKEVKEREHAKASRSKESMQDEEREKGKQAVERATREARERAAIEARDRAAIEARLKAERSAVQRAQAEARQRAAVGAKERAERAATEAREKEKATATRAEERAAVERVTAEARNRAAVEARERAAASRMTQQKNDNDLDSFFNAGTRPSSAPRPRASSGADSQSQNKRGPEGAHRASTGVVSSNTRKAPVATSIVDDLSSIFGGGPSPTGGQFQEVEGETEERRRARLEREQRTQERAAKALAEKNQRDLQSQRDQEERHRIGGTLDTEIKRWAAGKEGNLRALLSTLQYVLWPECGWQAVSLTDLITGANVKKAYRKATLCIHPDKVQQKGATLQQKYVAEKVFDILKEAWNKFNSEELF